MFHYGGIRKLSRLRAKLGQKAKQEKPVNA